MGFFKTQVLPNIAQASQSDLALLARRIIEKADISAIAPFIDELMELGRYSDAKAVRDAIAECASKVLPKKYDNEPQNFGHFPIPIRTNNPIVSAVMQVAWFDLFDLGATLNALDAYANEFDEYMTAHQKVPFDGPDLIQYSDYMPGGAETENMLRGAGTAYMPVSVESLVKTSSHKKDLPTAAEELKKIRDFVANQNGATPPG